MRGWVSPRLGVRFDLDGLELCLTGPDGERFASFLEVFQQARGARQHAVAEFMARQAAEQRAEAEAVARREAEQRAAAAEAELVRLRALLESQDGGRSS